MSLNKAILALLALSVLPGLAAAEGEKLEKGRAVYQAVCIACHAPENVMVSAPKTGDLTEWARRAGPGPDGLQRLIEHAIEGFGAMPPKGGRADLTRAQIRDAIEFMRRDPGAGVTNSHSGISGM